MTSSGSSETRSRTVPVSARKTSSGTSGSFFSVARRQGLPSWSGAPCSYPADPCFCYVRTCYILLYFSHDQKKGAGGAGGGFPRVPCPFPFFDDRRKRKEPTLTPYSFLTFPSSFSIEGCVPGISTATAPLIKRSRDSSGSPSYLDLN